MSADINTSMNPFNLFRLRYDYHDPINNIRARGLIVSVMSTLILAITFTIVRFINLSLAGEPISTQIILLVLSMPITLAIYVAVQNGHLQAASYLTLVVLLLITGMMAFNEDGHGRLSVIALIIAGGTLFGTRGAILTTLLALAIGAFGIINPILEDQNLSTFEYLLSMSAVLVGSSLLIVAFVTSVQSAATKTNRTIQGAITTLSRFVDSDQYASDIQLLQALLVNIEDTMRYDIAHVYLTEFDGTFQRHVTRSSSEAMTPINSKSLRDSGISKAIMSLQPIIVHNTDLYALRSHHYPGMATSLSLPLIYDSRLLGVLDVQSHRATMINESSSGILQLVATQIAQKLGYQREVADLGTKLKEKEVAIQRQRDHQDSNRQLPLHGLTSSSHIGSDESLIGFDISDHSGTALPNDALTPEIQEALERDDLHIEMQPETNEQIVMVPILLRGTTLGALSFTMPAQVRMTQAQLDLVRQVAQRLAMAIENRILFEQSEAIAHREIMANEVGQMLLSTTHIDTVLAIAAEQFNSTLGAVQTRIRIKPQDTEYHAKRSQTDASSEQPHGHLDNGRDHAEERA
ncbi:MAG: hypothetical protein CL607_12135 [Anaerolineaceae bacterium]|nr:hypothetical protein [Anaerolineaceae bacterium]